MSDLPETCDFCDLVPGEDEGLVEVRLGSVPQPDSIYVEGTDGQYRNEGNRSAQGRLLMELLDDHPLFDVQAHDMVEEVRAVGGETHFAEKPSNLTAHEWESEYHDDKVGVRCKVFPEAIESETDAMLCESCTEMLQ